MRLTVRGSKTGCWRAKVERDWNCPSIVIQSIVNEQWGMDPTRANQCACRPEVVGGKASHDQVIGTSQLPGGVAPQGKLEFDAAPVEVPAAVAGPILEQNPALGASPDFSLGERAFKPACRDGNQQPSRYMIPKALLLIDGRNGTGTTWPLLTM